MRASRLITSVGLLLVGLGLWIGFVGEPHEKRATPSTTAVGTPAEPTGAANVVRPASPADLPGLTLLESRPATEAQTEAAASSSGQTASAPADTASGPTGATEILGRAATVAGGAALTRQATPPDLGRPASAMSENAGVMRPLAVRPPQSAIDEAVKAANSDASGEARKSATPQRRIRATTPRPAKPQVRESSNLFTNPLGVR
ncbi:MAG: hypothetical protein ACK4MF_02220 [Hyphomicrobiaceae bacterium]